MTNFIGWCGIVTGLTYCVVLATGTVLGRAAKATYDRMVRAVQWTRIALALAVVTLALRLVAAFAGSDWISPAIWLGNVILAAWILRTQRQTREIYREMDDWRWRS